MSIRSGLRTVHLLALGSGLVASAAEDDRGDGPAWRFVDPEGDGEASATWMADVNGDGLQDVLVHDPRGAVGDPDREEPGRVYIFFGGASLSLTPDQVIGAQGGAAGTVSDAPGSWGDVNGDGAADQLTWVGDPHAGSRALQLRLGGPAGLEPVAVAVPIDDATVPWRFGDKVPVGPIEDLNGDGFGDVFLQALMPNQAMGDLHLAFHLGGAVGLSQVASWRYEWDLPEGGGAKVHRIGDVDADGLQETLMVFVSPAEGGGYQGEFALFRGDADGPRDAYWQAALLGAPVAGLGDLGVASIGDLDGNGRDDTVMMVRPLDPSVESTLTLYPGDANYGFAFSTPEVWSGAAAAPGPWLWGVGDVDGSGEIDVPIGLPSLAVPGGQGVGGVQVLLADGAWLPRAGARWMRADDDERGFGAGGAVGDVNGDGRDDLVVLTTGAAEVSAGSVALYLGYFDVDGDHADDAVDDCDPGDAGVHPGAEEVWYDGIDQDCDGNDEDRDVDGYPVEEDCDELNPEVNFGAEEVWYDGVDQDCDGNDGDQDYDGYVGIAGGGEDCDDLDPLANPGAVEVPGNARDEDCDGVVREALEELTPVEEGCGCRVGGGGAVGWLWVFGVIGGRRRVGRR